MGYAHLHDILMIGLTLLLTFQMLSVFYHAPYYLSYISGLLLIIFALKFVSGLIKGNADDMAIAIVTLIALLFTPIGLETLAPAYRASVSIESAISSALSLILLPLRMLDAILRGLIII